MSNIKAVEQGVVYAAVDRFFDHLKESFGEEDVKFIVRELKTVIPSYMNKVKRAALIPDDPHTPFRMKLLVKLWKETINQGNLMAKAPGSEDGTIHKRTHDIHVYTIGTNMASSRVLLTTLSGMATNPQTATLIGLISTSSESGPSAFDRVMELINSSEDDNDNLTIALAIVEGWVTLFESELDE